MSVSHFFNSRKQNGFDNSHPWAGLGQSLGPVLGRAWAALDWAWVGLGRNAEGWNDLTPARDLGISFIKVSHSVWHILA